MHAKPRWRERYLSVATASGVLHLSDIPTAELLASSHFNVYIRQSTPDQLVHNKESQRRQYALADRARQLGWTGVEIVDDDLGRSGGGVARPGFDRLIGAICAGDVGAVLAIEASRLARNGDIIVSPIVGCVGPRRGRVSWNVTRICRAFEWGDAVASFTRTVPRPDPAGPGKRDSEPGGRTS
jgi:hypothetical protein